MSTPPTGASGAHLTQDAPNPVALQRPGPSALAQRLGNAGLIPFVGGAFLVWIVRPEAHPFVTLSLAAYAALIVSFLGGIHWGLAARGADSSPGSLDLAADRALAWGVVPSLLAWIGVMMPPYAGLVVLGAVLVACYAVDRKRYPVWGLQAWLTMRFRLTVVASLSCFLGAAGS